MIDDDEMARINIEASAVLAQWIELMRTDDGYFRKMVKTAQVLPMLPPLLDERTNDKLYRTISLERRWLGGTGLITCGQFFAPRLLVAFRANSRGAARRG